jgi:hypothetical protein
LIGPDIRDRNEAAMTLFINNDVAHELLTMDDTMTALEEAYRQLIDTDAVCRPRIDVQIPTGETGKIFQWGTMEGGSTSGYFAIRMKSDIIYEQRYNDVLTQEQYCVQPGTFCGLILLISTRDGEPLAIINDGVIQHMRVGADGGIGVKYMAREDAEVVGMLGSGGMARAHMESFTRVRNIKKLQVFSPTRENRETFGEEMREKHGIEVVRRWRRSTSTCALGRLPRRGRDRSSVYRTNTSPMRRARTSSRALAWRAPASAATAWRCPIASSSSRTLSGARIAAARQMSKSHIPSAAICRAPNSTAWRGVSTSWPRPRA